MSVETIIKSDGSRVPFDPEKLNKWAQFASDNDVSWSDITLKAIRKCYDGCSTKDIHQAMIDVCVEQEDNKHLRMAGRLLIGIIYKEAHGGYSNIPTLTEFYKDMVQRNLWTSMDYSDEELEFLNKHLDHNKNISELYSYTALKQMRDKYLGQDLISKQCYESPQFMFMGCAMQAMEQQPKERRLEDIVKTYEYLSDLKINLSTPMLVNLRTPMKGLASCCVYTAGDTAPSLSVGDHIAYMMTCASAGIGSHLLTRSKGDPVRQGAVVHQGKLPYYKVIQSAVHANKQACYDDKTLVLTNTGFKLFSELNDDDLVAQVHDDGTVDFIEPIEGFVYDVDGELVTFTDENGNSLWVTDNHKMVVMDTSPIDPEDFHGDDTDEIPLFSMIEAGELELDNKLKFKLSADTKVNNSDTVSYTDYLLVLVKTFGIEDGKVILPEYSVEFEDHVYHLNENIDGVGYDEENIELILNPELLKVLNSKQETLLTRLGRNQLRELLNYMLFLAIAKDGWRDVADIQFFQEIASISGLVVQVRGDSIKIDEEQTTIVPTTSFTKGVVEYTGKVFCVEVPTNRLIVKRDDLVMVCGNSRGGANTTYFSVLDPEIDDLLVLKNPTTVLQKRIRDIDYAVNVNRLFVEKVARNEEWLTISYFHAKDLYDAFYSSDYEKFKELYESYLDHPKAKIHKARDIAIKMLTESVETGRIYVTYIDEANRHTPFRTGEVLDDGSIDRIYSSNLCVAPETKILTKDGYQEISSLKDVEVEVWNGEEWSQTTVRQTGVEQKLLNFEFSNGSELSCTPYHKFYIQNEYATEPVEVRASDLKVGDKLIKYDLPLIHGSEKLENAYLNGFFSGDGCQVNETTGRVYLYGDKMKLKDEPEFNIGGTKWNGDGVVRITRDYRNILMKKFFVPSNKYTIKSRLDWLAGIMDSDGSIYRNGSNHQLVLSSVNKEFLNETKLMLQTLGVDSKVTLNMTAGLRKLPLNDGSGEYGEFMCQEAWRLIITSNGLGRLIDLGIEFKRLDVSEYEYPQRDAKHFIRVTSIVDNGRIDDTYCFTEPKRHMGMFNGILTGQCNEIMLVTKEFTNMQDLYSDEPFGEIGLCSLSSIVQGRVTDEEYEDVAYYTLLFVDNTLEIMDYPFPSLRRTARARRNIGIGMTNLAHDIASRGLSYTTQEGKKYIHYVSERHAYYLYKASLQLAKEKGIAEWMYKTKYPQGWLPIDTYNRNVDDVVPNDLHFDWEELRQGIIEMGGIRNSTVTAIPPNESSSLLTNTTNSIYPIRSLRVIKTSGTGRNILLAPDYEKLKNKYDIVWDMDMKDVIDLYAIVQKFTDQGISSDLYVSYQDSDTISTREILSHFIYMMKMGCKSRYYINSQAGVDKALYNRGEVKTEVIDVSDQCDSCVL